MSTNETLNVTVSYREESSPYKHISNAIVEINGSGISELLVESFSNYSMLINTTDLNQGVNFLTIIAQKDGYKPQSILLIIEIIQKETSLTLFLDGEDKTTNPSIDIIYGDILNITIKYTDIGTGAHISGATVELSGSGLLENLTENSVLKHYWVIINTTNLDIGVLFLTIFSQKTNFEPQTILVTIEIHERETGIEIYLNQIDKTLDRYIELPIGAYLNITIKYIDILTDFLLKNATIQLLGEGFDLLFNENNILEQYSIIINTDQLDIGVKFLTIYAQKPNYQSYSVVLRIVVRRINTEITISSGESTINIKPGESSSIKLVLNDLDFNQTIKNALVTYTWALGQGTLLDSNNDGIYETTLTNVPEGTYTITISVYAGDNYEFERYRITLNVIRPPEESLLFIILTIVSIAAALGIGGYFIAYQRVLKYPKSVRKIRKYKSTLKKKDAPNVEIHSRTELLKMHYQEELESNVKTLIEKRKSKLIEQKSSFDKLLKAEDEDLSQD